MQPHCPIIRTNTLNRFCDALQNKDVENVEKIFTEYLTQTSHTILVCRTLKNQYFNP